MQASIESTGTSQQRAHGWLTDQALLTATTVVLLVILCLPVFAANRSPLNSDQSLYLAEALNIADGEGLTYPTGKPITHRAPLYPALLAGAFKLDGATLDAAYVVPRLSVVANVLLLFFLGRALFGAWGGAVAGITAAASLYLRGLGTTLFLDSTQVTFLLAALLVYCRAGSSVPRMACAGALLGASFLIKEASVLFLPLPVVVSLLYGFDAGWKKTLPAWYAGFAAATAWWFVWVFIHTGDPAEFYKPMDYQNERWLELALFPGRRIPEGQVPRFDSLMAERDNLFRRHPKTTFVAAHLGWQANDLATLGKLLDLPNVYTEVGAVLYDIGRQPRAARDFFIKYQDRILFGKDSFQPQEYPYYWRVFETRDDYFDYYRDYHAFWKLYGIDLPDEVLKKVYYQNALKIVKGLPREGWPR